MGRFSLNKVLLVSLLSVALTVAGCKAAEPVANVESESKKIVVFEGGEVTLGEVQTFAEQSGFGELSPDSPEYKTAVAQIMPQLVEIEIAKAYAAEQGITVSEQEVDEEIETIKDEIARQAEAQGQDIGREEAFRTALEQAGITEEQLRDQIRENLPVQKVQERVAGGAEPSREEIEKFYEENKEFQFTTPEERCMRHILFNKDQKAKAGEVKQQLEEGADFAELAKENSQDPGSAEQGGDLGCLAKGETVPNFEDAAFSAEKGEIVGPVETQFGYHIIEVTDINAKNTRSLEEVEGEIQAQLSGEIQAEEFSAWVNEQEKKRDVTYLPGYKPPA